MPAVLNALVRLI